MDASRLERRVLAVAPTSRDARTTQVLLESAGIAAETCATFDALLAELERGAAAVLIPEEAIVNPPASARFWAVLERQAAWSDLPVLVLVRQGARSAAAEHAVRTLGNVVLLERPIRVVTFLSAVRTALRARDRQLQIRELLQERARAEQALRLADQRKDEFLATLGHELRNPLAPLVTGLHLLRAAGSGDPCVQGLTPIMERQLQHLVRLVDDLLEVSRITRGLVAIQREPIDVLVPVRSAVEISRPSIDAASHTLLVDLPAAPIIVVGDVVRLTQVFANLLTNAAKYTDTGGIIRLSVAGDGDRVRIAVSDNGIGIPESQLEAVFDMFMQIDRSSRRVQGGLGIGLTLARSLIALHGGQVEAHSGGPGTGAEFVVTLPMAPLRSQDTPTPDGPAPFPARRVLLVDDNRDAATTFAALLETFGLTVAVAHGGQEALDRLATGLPDLVLLDIGMPGMDGYEVARRIRNLPGGERTMLIALTGWGQDQDIEQARAAGFDHHLVKPPDLDKLRAWLTAAPKGGAGGSSQA